MAHNLGQTKVLEIARATGRALVKDVAEHCNVTLQTIRRDLTKLSKAGHPDRIHGSAIPRIGVSTIGQTARRRMNEGAKAAIPDTSSMTPNLGATPKAAARASPACRNETPRSPMPPCPVA